MSSNALFVKLRINIYMLRYYKPNEKVKGAKALVCSLKRFINPVKVGIGLTRAQSGLRAS